ncbi:MAG: NAD(P)-dependent oxidoreductase [Bdellovibrionales bacterium]|nr:NAD(P)-dependent oxidoreductase [Bdellovibrionales bacterium]
MKIAVTGGCGYVGSTLIPKLAKLADEVRVLDLNPPALQKNAIPDNVSHYQLDIANQTALKPLLQGVDLIIHLAALVGYPACNKAPDVAVRCNVGGTTSVLRNKEKHAPVLLASTCSNYGEQNGLVTEETPLNPTSLYGKTKVRAEELVLRDSRNIVFRFAGGFGRSPLTRDDLLIHDFVSQAVFGIPLSIYESHFVRQFIHVQDMTNAIVFAILNWETMKGNVYNVGNPDIEITKKDLIEEMCKQLDFDYKFENSGMDLERRNYPVSFEKLLSQGFKPTYSLAAGIKELIQYYLEEKTRRARTLRRPTQPTI